VCVVIGHLRAQFFFEAIQCSITWRSIGSVIAPLASTWS
jgi:hypothetical protein